MRLRSTGAFARRERSGRSPSTLMIRTREIPGMGLAEEGADERSSRALRIRYVRFIMLLERYPPTVTGVLRLDSIPVKTRSG